MPGKCMMVISVGSCGMVFNVILPDPPWEGRGQNAVLFVNKFIGC